MSKVVFFKDSHTYWHGDRKLSSVGVYIKQFFPRFDEDYWITHSVLKELFGDEYKEHYRSFGRFMPERLDLFIPFIEKVDLEDFHNKTEEIRQMWDRKRNESAFKGSAFHDLQEKKIYQMGGKENPFTGRFFDVVSSEKEYDNESISLNLYDLEDGLYPELLVFNLDRGVAGQADEVYIETIGGVRYVDINDHKTNEKKPQKTSPDYCLPPMDYLYASTHNKYAIQINSYARLLQDHGFVPRNLAYTHYKKYNEKAATLVELEDFSKEMEIIFEQTLHV